jgi:hypothetical protein
MQRREGRVTESGLGAFAPFFFVVVVLDKGLSNVRFVLADG